MQQSESRQQEQLTLINPIDRQTGYSASLEDDPTWDSPRTRTHPAPYAEPPTLEIGDTVEVLPYTDSFGFQRGQFDKAVVTAIHGDRITLAIPGIVTREGYVCGIERLRKI